MFQHLFGIVKDKLKAVLCTAKILIFTLAKKTQHNISIEFIFCGQKINIFIFTCISSCWLLQKTKDPHRTSQQTMFFCVTLSFTYTATDFELKTLLNATYSCPWLNTWSSKYMPTKSRVCFCALFVDIAKYGLTGNWCLLSVNGNSVSDGAMVILGIRTQFPLFIH